MQTVIDSLHRHIHSTSCSAVACAAIAAVTVVTIIV